MFDMFSVQCSPFYDEWQYVSHLSSLTWVHYILPFPFLLFAAFQYFTFLFIRFDISSEHFDSSPEPHVLLALLHPSPNLIVFQLIRIAVVMVACFHEYNSLLMSDDNFDDTDENLDDEDDYHLLHSFLEVTPPSVLFDIRQPEQQVPAHDNND